MNLNGQSLNDDALDRAWDQLVQASHVPEREKLMDRQTAETLRRLNDLGSAPPPNSSRERVRGGVSATLNRQQQFSPGGNGPMKQATTMPVPFPQLPAVKTRMFLGVWESRPARRKAALIAAAVAILITSAVVVFDRGGSGPGAPKTVPAAVITSGTPETTTWQVKGTTEVIPEGRKEIRVGRAVLEPGTILPWLIEDGSQIHFVESGTVSVSADGPITYFGSESAASDGTEREVSAGQGILAAAGTTVTIKNIGGQPAEVLHAILTDSTTPASMTATGPWRLLKLGYTGTDAMTAPATVSLRRITIVPDETKLQSSDAAGNMIVVAPDTGSAATKVLDEGRSEIVFYIGKEPVDAWLFEVTWAPAAEATPIP